MKTTRQSQSNSLQRLALLRDYLTVARRAATNQAYQPEMDIASIFATPAPTGKVCFRTLASFLELPVQDVEHMFDPDQYEIRNPPMVAIIGRVDKYLRENKTAMQ